MFLFTTKPLFGAFRHPICTILTAGLHRQRNFPRTTEHWKLCGANKSSRIHNHPLLICFLLLLAQTLTQMAR